MRTLNLRIETWIEFGNKEVEMMKKEVENFLFMRIVEKPRVMLILISDITLMNNSMTGTIRKGLVGRVYFSDSRQIYCQLSDI